jgi:uncharacterized 2Fe-2S/4Fe-4S cluster protein (DUF4445 family)
VDGAITNVRVEQGKLVLETLAGKPPIGLTGSGLLTLIHQLRQADVITESGRISASPGAFQNQIEIDPRNGRRILFTADKQLGLTQWDVRELQKAKAAIRASIDILMANLGLAPADLQRVILTGSFGSQVDCDSALGLGMLPPVRRETIEMIANGAGLGAAMFLSDEGFALGESLALRAEHIELDQTVDFLQQYVDAMALKP